ncbi:unnamed protein product [Choristocarpus tenellus]
MCIESLPRRPFVVTVDDVTLAMKFRPGARGQGAILEGWTDPIPIHDKKVLELEEAILEEKQLVAELRYYSRVERNWEITYGVLDEEPHKWEEFQVLRADMQDYEKKLQRVTTEEQRMALENQWDKFCEMQPRFEKILAAKEQFELVQADRLKVKQKMLQHSKKMGKLRQEEIEAAEAISNDHMHACELGKPLGNIFPAIQAQ